MGGVGIDVNSANTKNLREISKFLAGKGVTAWHSDVNRKTQNERGSIAGSVITMLDAVKMMRELGFSESEVSSMASANPARLLGIEKNHG